MRLARLPGGEPEIFTTIQGEGPSTGIPSVFVRLSLCNLHCDWCDTRYTWDWQAFDPKSEIVRLSTEDVTMRVLAAGVENVVFTGGEPLLQAEELGDVAEALKADGRRIEVETNGTIVPSAALGACVDQWNVSPKLANSGNAIAEREVAAALDWYAGDDRAIFKFVIVSQDDVGEVAALAKRYDVRASRIVLMPEGTDASTLNSRSPWLAEICRERGYRFSTRLHVLLWGDERAR